MKKVLFSAAILMAFATVSFAGTPETKTTKSDSPTEAKAQQDETTYYVVGQSGSNYLLSTSPSNEGNCTGSPIHPCKFTSPEPDLGTSIPKSTVINQEDDIQILAYRETLP